MINIRPEKTEDISRIRAINENAFGQPDEANIVNRLRETCPDILSLVAEDNGKVVGHIMFSPATIENDGVIKHRGVGLAPMAVLPDHQKQGIGSLLIREGLEIIKKRECQFIIVLGHPEYYPKFGFERASHNNIKSQWPDIPDEALMVIIFDKSIESNIHGTAYYRKEFGLAGQPDDI